MKCRECGMGLKIKVKIEKKEEAAPVSLVADRVILEKQPKKLTAIQKVVLAYKLAKGYQAKDKEWDNQFFKMWVRSAQSILKYLNNEEDKAIDCICEISEELEKKNLEWNLNTIVKRLPDWQKVNLVNDN